MFDVRWTPGAKDDMKRMKLRTYEVRRIIDGVDDQLTHEPERETKHKKIIRADVELGFEHLEPVGQLSVGDFRVFYDVAKHDETVEVEAEKGPDVVSIRAVRHKPAHLTTEEIL
jgi:mRNA-degrading endonuclease RelE of RelBE toxin-antitoxin system